MPDLIPFQFHSTTITTMTDETGVPWFIAAEACDVLDIRNVSQAVSRLDADEKNTICLNDGMRGNPETLIINEYGLYRLAMTSRKKIAKEFQRWIAHEVLPQIRKTGKYEHPVPPAIPAQTHLETIRYAYHPDSFREAPRFSYGDGRKVALQGQQTLIVGNLCDIIIQYEDHIASETIADC